MQVPFTAEALREAAEQKAGHGDYGSESYRAALEPLLYSIEHESALNALGRREMWDRIVGALANRLTVRGWEKANPELASAPVVAPVIILGLPRTGSSILHETLAAAPGLRTPLIWEVRDYSLVHQVQDARSDERIRKIDAEIERKKEVAPGYAAIHYEDALIPMECVALTILDLVSTQFSTIAWAPTYRRYLTSQDGRETYRWHQRAVRYLQARTPGKRWVLKAPMHSLYIEALLETYPDAKVVQTHRHPAKVIGSQVSLNDTLRRAWSDAVDIKAQAPLDAAYTAEAIRRAVAYRVRRPQEAARFHDVAFAHFMADQAGTLERIFKHCGMDFTDAARAATLGYLEDRPREKYGRHDYALEQFGLTPEALAPLFAEYLERYRAYL